MTVFDYFDLAYKLLTGLTILLHVIAPLTTKWTGDDRLAQFLLKLQSQFNSRALLPEPPQDKE
jgi:hypothetical protein